MKTITFFESNADKRFAGRKFRLIPVKWDYDESAYIETSEDEMEEWAIYHPHGGELSPFSHHPSEFGTIS